MSYREKQQKNSSDSIKHRCFHSCLQRSRQRAPLSCRVGSNCTTTRFWQSWQFWQFLLIRVDQWYGLVSPRLRASVVGNHSDKNLLSCENKRIYISCSDDGSSFNVRARHSFNSD